jgi:hypothetical protein
MSYSYILFPEKDVEEISKENVIVLPEFFKISTLLMENLLVLTEFLKNKYLQKSPKNIEFLRKKYFIQGNSTENV